MWQSQIGQSHAEAADTVLNITTGNALLRTYYYGHVSTDMPYYSHFQADSFPYEDLQWRH
jgi:hypothetical protein